MRTVGSIGSVNFLGQSVGTLAGIDKGKADRGFDEDDED